MADCATTEKMRFDTPTSLAAPEAAFDGGGITSDGGPTSLAEANEELGPCQAIAGRVPEWRSGKVRATLWSRSSSNASSS
jgi:hypothetical protein